MDISFKIIKKLLQGRMSY